MGYQPLLQPDKEHHRKLQPLCLVQGNACYGIGLRIHAIQVGVEGTFFEKGAELILLREIGIFPRHAAQLLHVLPAFEAFLLAILPHEHVAEANGFQYFVNQVGQVELVARSNEPLHHRKKPPQGIACPGRKEARTFPVCCQVLHSLIHRNGLLVCPGLQGPRGLVADTSPRHIDNALQVDIVGLVEDKAKIGHHIANFLTIIEPSATDNLIGQPVANKCFLKSAALCIGAIHHGAIAGAILAALYQTDNLIGHAERFIVGIVALYQHNGFPAPILCPEVFDMLLLPFSADNRPGRIENGLRAAVVLFEQEYLRLRVVVFKAENVFPIGSAPAIDRLVFVAHNKELTVFCRKLLHKNILRVVGVLIFIYEDVGVAMMICRQNIRIFLEQPHRFHQEVIKIKRIVLEQEALVSLIAHRVEFVPIAPAARQVAGELFGGNKAVFCVGDTTKDSPRGGFLFIKLKLPQGLAHKPFLVVAIVDDKIALTPQVDNIAPQEASTDAMEGSHGEGRCLFGPHHLCQSFFHLPGRFVCKGDSKNGEGVNATFVDEMGHAVGEDAGFAAAWPGQHKHRAITSLHRLPLNIVEISCDFFAHKKGFFLAE